MIYNEIDQGMAVTQSPIRNCPFSPIWFLNMDISLINAFICLKIYIHIAETCLKEKLSQDFDIGLSLYFMVCRIREFENKIKNMPKVTCFLS